MSKKAIDAFRQKLLEDEALRSEMKRVLSADGTKGTASADELVQFASAQGYAFTADEAREGIELSDRDLDAVAGGFADGHYKSSLKLQDSYKQEYNIESMSLNFVKLSRP